MLRPPRILLVSSKYPPEYFGSGNRVHALYRRLMEDHGIRVEVLAGAMTENTCASY